ncbi:MAG: SDR family NAD(P)-dependent oxidoreductase, partial [Actinobacteria bacterium]|nr:SDR family NAD(P)-dependent oxidoreductase [Actinomycetota bacterium]
MPLGRRKVLPLDGSLSPSGMRDLPPKRVFSVYEERVTSMPLSSLEGRVALVTGASRGIGTGCAEVLAELGATVAVNYNRGQVEAEKVVAHLKTLGRDSVALQADVSDPAEARRLVHWVIDRFGKLDIVVNNAGFNASPPVIMQMSPEETVERWHSTLNTNLAS